MRVCLFSVSLRLLLTSAGDSCGSKSFSPCHLELSWADPLLQTPLSIILIKSTAPGVPLCSEVSWPNVESNDLEQLLLVSAWIT